jgi:PAS domain S-box-containing protein
VHDGEKRIERLRARVLQPTLLLSESLQELSTAYEELRVAEEQLAEHAELLWSAHESLAAEQRKFRELLHALPYATLISDALGNIVDASPRFSDWMQAKPECVLGKPLTSYVATEDRALLRATLTQLRRERRPATLCVRMRPLGDKSGVWVELSVGVSDAQEDRLYWQARDIDAAHAASATLESRSLQLERQLLEGKRELETTQYLLQHALREHQHFIAHTGRGEHYDARSIESLMQAFRMFLSSVGGRLRMLLGGSANDEQRAIVASLSRSVRSLTRLLHDVDSKAAEQRFAGTVSLDFVAFVRDVLELRGGPSHDRQVHVLDELPDHRKSVRANPHRLRQVVGYLLDLAIDATRPDAALLLRFQVLDHSAALVLRPSAAVGVADALVAAADALKPPPQTKPTLLGRRLGLYRARLLAEIDGGAIEFAHAEAEVRLRLPFSGSAVTALS